MEKTALFLANGFEEIEALTVVDLLRRQGIEITTVSITDAVEVTGSHNITVKADTVLGKVDFSSFDMLILPGGQPGTTNLGNCKALTEELIKHNDAGKDLAAICAAPTVYGKLGLLQGKRACCYPGCEDALLGANVQTAEVTVDGNFITSRGMGTAIPFGLAIIERFCGKAAADDMAKKIVFNK